MREPDSAFVNQQLKALKSHQAIAESELNTYKEEEGEKNKRMHFPSSCAVNILDATSQDQYLASPEKPTEPNTLSVRAS